MSGDSAVDRFIRAVTDPVVRRWDRNKDPESLIGLCIVTFWFTLPGLRGGLLLVAILVGFGWFLHMAAVESGNHVVLWLTTSSLLVLIVLGIELTVGGLPPIPTAVAGATALGHNELVRINYARRRNAVIGEDVFLASALGIGAATIVGVAGVALIQLLDSETGRSWLWMPAAVLGLMVIGFGFAIVPAIRADKASKERWQPGDRIPPQPLAQDNIERF